MNERDVQARIAAAERIVVKVGSSSLTSHGHLDVARLEALVAAIATIQTAGKQVVLVTSGAIAAGLQLLGFTHRPNDLARQQAAAAVGQGLLIAQYTHAFAAHGISAAQVLLTVEDVTRRESYANALRTLDALLRLGVVPIINENDTVATHEIRFGDNDRLAALSAELVRANALVLLSDIDGVYTAHPDDPGAERISFVPDASALVVDAHKAGSSVGTGGMATKLDAAIIATSAGVPVVLARADQAAAALAGQPVGTAFAPDDNPKPAKLWWLAHASVAKGVLRVDEGAANALVKRHKSLLAAGITDVSGDFSSGDPVDVAAPDGQIIARGLVNFGSDELPQMLGKRSSQLVRELGAGFDREVIHRDSLVWRFKTGVTGTTTDSTGTTGVTDE
ncbi:MAG: glutamate 5-kinase [Propionibacteriaceae bacterium]|nr:glutamate 5-kinase [Propionibacteriaceae bacterium]